MYESETTNCQFEKKKHTIETNGFIEETDVNKNEFFFVKSRMN